MAPHFREDNHDTRTRMAELSFATDIRPLFRDKDVQKMKGISGLDLADYDQVRRRAPAIHARLADGTMPCDRPWSADDIDTFKAWMDAGAMP